MDPSSCKGQMLAVCMRVPNELAVSVLRGPVRNRNRHSSTGNRAYRKSVCVSSRPVGARTRKTGLAGAWLSGRVTRFDYYYCQKRPVPASLFSLFLLLRFFRPGERGPFFLATHSRTHVTCARSTRHSRMRYAYVRGFFDVTNLNATNVGEGRASATSLVAPPIFPSSWKWIFSRERRSSYFSKRFSFCAIL